MDEREYLKERKEKAISLLKKKQLWAAGFLIIALILGVYIRSLPMTDHGGRPGLWDIASNSWTLGPDLDPFLFLRYAKTIVENGAIPEIDSMRYVPLGFDTSGETKLLPYMIAFTHYIISAFKNTSVEFSAALFPVIMFALTIISFFFFVREIFAKNSNEAKTKANLIALISTFFMIVIPTFLPRTVAGIPEKESASFFFMFLSFYLFLKAWKSEKTKNYVLFAILAGISTALMGLIWGGVVYIFTTIGIANFIAFIINKTKKRGFFIYSGWIASTLFFLLTFSNKYSLLSLIKSTDYMIAFVTFYILFVDFVLWNTPVSNMNLLKKTKHPKNIVSVVIAVFSGAVIASAIFGPSFIPSKFSNLIDTFINPTTGRWGVTVAENRQPYFREWASSFGPFLKGIPILFWLFFAGSVVMFKQMLKNLKKKDSLTLTAFYVLFFFGLVFSRYSSSSAFNGENLISKAFYFGSAILLLGFLIYYYTKYEKEGHRGFEKIEYEILFLFALLILTLFTVRSAVRLVMVLAPIAPIFAGYLIYETSYRFAKSKEETQKIIFGVLAILIIIASMFAFVSFYKAVKVQSYGFVPSSYTHQWQKAMKWVRDETPKDSVFGHWWDYGYWVQSIGERATVLDGGNAIAYWNYLMGRNVLTGDNQKDALDFLYSHNTTYFLIDSTDIGKYTAFSSIGSNEDYDRYSWIGSFLLDERQIKETRNQTIYVYTGGTMLDEDLIIEENGKEVLLPKQRAGVGAIIITAKREGNVTRFSQPYAVMIYQGVQYNVYLRYLSIAGDFTDFGSGIEATAYVFPRLDQQGQGIRQNPIGAAMYLSPRLMRGMLSQVYILNDPFGNFGAFELVHTEPSIIIDSLRKQGMNLPEFVYFRGLQGPIKIWKINYTGDEEVKQEYLDKDYSKYISWRL